MRKISSTHLDKTFSVAVHLLWHETKNHRKLKQLLQRIPYDHSKGLAAPFERGLITSFDQDPLKNGMEKYLLKSPSLLPPTEAIMFLGIHPDEKDGQNLLTLTGARYNKRGFLSGSYLPYKESIILSKHLEERGFDVLSFQKNFHYDIIYTSPNILEKLKGGDYKNAYKLEKIASSRLSQELVLKQ